LAGPFAGNDEGGAKPGTCWRIGGDQLALGRRICCRRATERVAEGRPCQWSKRAAVRWVWRLRSTTAIL